MGVCARLCVFVCLSHCISDPFRAISLASLALQSLLCIFFSFFFCSLSCSHQDTTGFFYAMTGGKQTFFSWTMVQCNFVALTRRVTSMRHVIRFEIQYRFTRDLD